MNYDSWPIKNLMLQESMIHIDYTWSDIHRLKRKKVTYTCCIDPLLDLMVPWIFLASQNALLAPPSSIFPLC